MKHIHPLVKEYGELDSLDWDRLWMDIQMAISEGAVNEHTHPNHPSLVGYDYSEKCTYDKLWDEHPVARFCRGLVLDVVKCEVVCLCPAKFMNLTEPGCDITPEELINTPLINVEEKVDGSAGLIFKYNGEWIVKTRGSFISDQAKMASTWLQNDGLPGFEGISFFAEIIYPENRVIVDYGDYRGFISIGCYNRHGDWFEIPSLNLFVFGLVKKEHCTYEMKRTKYSFDTLQEVMKTLSSNEEGFIIIMKDGRRCKMKGEQYLILHKAKFGLTPIAVWEAMKAFKVEEARKLLPEEFHNTFDSYNKSLINKVRALEHEYYRVCEDMLETLPDAYTRKDFALAVQKFDKKYHPYCFAILKDSIKEIHDIRMNILLALVYPKNNIIE